MSRQDEFKNKSTNPAKRFLQWKSDGKCFSYYDKDKTENVKVELPFKFLTLMEMHTVKGWHDPSQSAIYSNEVKRISKEPLNVRSFKGGPIAKGLYRDIKPMLSGGHYVKSIYIMTPGPEGELLNIQLKGAAVQSWGDFVNDNRSRITEEWVEVHRAEEKTKGSIKYSVPLFKFNMSLNDVEYDRADAVYNELKSYMDDYLAPDEKQATEQLYEAAKEQAIEMVKEDGQNIIAPGRIPASMDEMPEPDLPF